MFISEKTCKAHPLGSAKQSKLRRPGHRATPGRCAATAALPLSFLSKSPEPCFKKKKNPNPSPFHREEKPPRVRLLPLRPSPPLPRFQTGENPVENAAPADPHSAVGVEVSPGAAAAAAQPFLLPEAIPSRRLLRAPLRTYA